MRRRAAISQRGHDASPCCCSCAFVHYVGLGEGHHRCGVATRADGVRFPFVPCIAKAAGDAPFDSRRGDGRKVVAPSKSGHHDARRSTEEAVTCERQNRDSRQMCL